MRTRRSRQEWIKLCEAFDASKETAKSFARRRGLQYRTLLWWRSQLRREGVAADRKRGFVEVVSEGTMAPPRAVLRIGEIVVEFNGDMPPASWISELAGRC